MQALRRQPERRYADAAAFRDDLARSLAGQPVAARRRRWRTPLAAPPRRRWAPAAAALALLAAIAIAAAIAVALGLGSSGRRDGPARRDTPSAGAPRSFPFDPSNPPPAEESERRLAAAPDDVVAAAALVLRLARDGRTEEARIVVGRMRQMPGRQDDPLVDFADGRLASLAGEDQRALVFYTRARDQALAAGRAELLGTIRTSRAATLSKLGQRDASRAELELARADSERLGDQRTLYRTLNGLALEHLQRGEMERGEAALRQALAAAVAAGVEPLVTLENLAAVYALQGRPDLGEAIARRLLDHYQRAGRTSDEGEVAKNLSQMLRDLGRSDEASAMRARALALLRISSNKNVLADALHAQGMVDLDAARLDRVEALAAELESTAEDSLKFLPLGYAHALRGRRAALAGDLATARGEFAEARRLLLAGGDRDIAARSDLVWARAEADAGDAAAALRILDEALAQLDQASRTDEGWFAETLRARIDAAGGRAADGRRRLDGLGEEAARSPSLTRRLALLGARAAVAAAEGRGGAARADLESALEIARRTGRKVAELELRLDLARLDGAAAREAAVEAVRGEAAALGLAGLAERAERARRP
jgi:serine/threonine-protein kinase